MSLSCSKNFRNFHFRFSNVHIWRDGTNVDQANYFYPAVFLLISYHYGLHFQGVSVQQTTYCAVYLEKTTGASFLL